MTLSTNTITADTACILVGMAAHVITLDEGHPACFTALDLIGDMGRRNTGYAIQDRHPGIELTVIDLITGERHPRFKILLSPEPIRLGVEALLPGAAA